MFLISIVLLYIILVPSEAFIPKAKSICEKSFPFITKRCWYGDAQNRCRQYTPESPVYFSLGTHNREIKQSEADGFKAKAQALKEEAEQLRSEIDQASQNRRPQGSTSDIDIDDAKDAKTTTTSVAMSSPTPSSPWTISSMEPPDEEDCDYRLYVDIGREEGTWMDPRWGASGKRIEFALDIKLLANRLANPEIAKKMVKDNTVGESSHVFALDTAQFARLRGGFDRMECTGGAYRIDVGRNGRSTLRMFVQVEGTIRADQSYIYGDLSIPSGCLYFSLPCFGNGISNLSMKEGVVSVRQIGWHTGWRREESRICGVFTAKPLLEARKRDLY